MIVDLKMGGVGLPFLSESVSVHMGIFRALYWFLNDFDDTSNDQFND
jgi:hypothetical protein